MALHQEKLATTHETLEPLASGALNPNIGTVYHWHRTWRQQHYGEPVDPIVKLSEKAPMYFQHGKLLALH